MTIHLINDKTFSNMEGVKSNEIGVTIIPNKHITDETDVTDELVNKHGIFIPWTSILYMS